MAGENTDKIMTIHDVARELGVSASTVSRAISGKGRIGEATRERIRNYIDEHGFYPNAAAQSLAQSKTNNIAIILPEVKALVDMPFFHTCMYGVEEVAQANDYDVIVGYRADDSYFSYAESFVENGLPLRCLNDALRLGKLGEQMVLVSEKVFERITFISASSVDKTIYYPKFTARDTEARETYRNEIRRSRSYRDDLFVLDILREELRNDDPRIQRIVSE